MNLLKNGACEEWTGKNLMIGEKNYLSGWSLEEHYGSISQENEIVYEGVSSARMSSPKPGITASISQKVVVSPGHTIRIRFHYYIEESCTGTKPRMYCYFREGGSDNIPNDVLSTFYDDATWGIIRGGGYGLSSFPLEYGEWQLFDYTIQVPAIAIMNESIVMDSLIVWLFILLGLLVIFARHSALIYISSKFSVTRRNRSSRPSPIMPSISVMPNRLPTDCPVCRSRPVLTCTSSSVACPCPMR